MSTTTATIPTTTAAVATTRRPVWRAGLAASAAAAAATTILAATATTAGITFAGPTGESIPLLGFTQLTFIFSLIGVALAAILTRRARRPRQTFIRTTIALTALSLIPDITFGFDAPSAITLMLLHIVAAAIVIPPLANRLPTHTSRNSR